MAEVTNELMYEVLKQVQSDVAGMKDAWLETNVRLNAMQSHLIGLQQDTQNIYSILTRHDAPLDRIERRLDIVEVA
jgi:hypothetical protein